MTASPVRRFGGKAKVARRIAALLPEHLEYIEPFFGAGSVFFAKQPAKLETINDIDGDVVLFFKVLRDRPNEFAALAALTPYSRQVYEECRKEWRSQTDPVRRAWAWWVVSLQSFGGGNPDATGWRKLKDARSRTSVAVEIWKKVEGLQAICDRLRYAQIEHRPAIEVLRRYATSNSLSYCDPPYLPDTRASESRYGHEMSATDHEELVETLLSTPGHKLLSGYPNKIYERLEVVGWRRISWNTKDSTARGSTKERLVRQECLWLSPGLPVPQQVSERAT